MSIPFDVETKCTDYPERSLPVASFQRFHL